MYGQRNLKARRYQAQVLQKTMSSRFEEYRDSPRGADSVAQGVADWLQAITDVAAEKQRQRLEQATAVEVRVVDVKKDDAA